MFARRKDMTSFHPDHPRLPGADIAHTDQASHMLERVPQQKSMLHLCLIALLLLILTTILFQVGVSFILHHQQILLWSSFGIKGLLPFFLVGLWGFLLLILVALLCRTFLRLLRCLHAIVR